MEEDEVDNVYHPHDVMANVKPASTLSPATVQNKIYHQLFHDIVVDNATGIANGIIPHLLGRIDSVQQVNLHNTTRCHTN